MANQENQQRKKRAKKVDQTAYDEYVTNVSNGLNPPSSAKKRRKRKVNPQAYEQFLQTEGKPEAVQSRRARREAAETGTQLKMKLDPPKAGKPRRAKKTPAEGYDSYLLRTESAEEMPTRAPKRSRGGKRRASQRKRQATAAYVAVMLLFLAGFGALTVRQWQMNQRYEMMREVVEDQRFYQGTTVDGYDVSGMTLEEATVFFENSVEPQYRNRSVSLTTGEMFTAEQLGYSSNYVGALRAAWANGRTGTLEQQYQAIVSGMHAATQHTVTRVFYTEDAVRAAVDDVARRVNQKPKNPQISGFDAKTLKFTLDEGQVGYELNREQLVGDILHVMANGGGKVEAIISTLPVTVDREAALAGYGRISYLQTDASTSSKNRLTNLRLSCEAINGYRLDPGQEFSFNGVVGQRTAAKGYKEAGVYAAGATSTDIGGGICQVGSTLFNVAVMADMDITARQPHSKPVSYLDRGRDAAIDWPGTDLKFVNITDSPVYIVTMLSDEKQVMCAIYGKLPEDGHTVKVTSRTYERMEFERFLKIDPTLAPGTHEVDKAGRTGYKAQAWKVTLDKDGNEIKKEHLCYSTYKKQDEYVRYNP